MHEYTSTACLHNMHKECRLSCKFCKIRCKCGCHKHDPKLLDELDPPQQLKVFLWLTSEGA